MASRRAHLKIHKGSHLIHKPSSSQQQRRRQPVIIYAKPPQVIYTNVRDFKAVVQKHTGLPQPAAKQCSASSSAPPPQATTISPKTTAPGSTSSSSSSSSFPEHCIIGGDNGVTMAPVASPDISFEQISPPAEPFLSDGSMDTFDLLTPNQHSDLLCPPGTPALFYEPSNPSVGAIASPDISFEPLPQPADRFLWDDTDTFDLPTLDEHSDFFCLWGTPPHLHEPSNPSMASEERHD